MSARYQVIEVGLGPFPLLNDSRTALYVSVVVKSTRGRLAQLHTVALEVRLSDARAQGIVVAGDPNWAYAAEFIVPPPELNLFLEGLDFGVFPPVRYARTHPEACRTLAEARMADAALGRPRQ